MADVVLISDVNAGASLLGPEHLLEDYRVKHWLQFHPVSWLTTWWQPCGNGYSVFLNRKCLSDQSRRIRASFPRRREALASTPCSLGRSSEPSGGTSWDNRGDAGSWRGTALCCAIAHRDLGNPLRRVNWMEAAYLSDRRPKCENCSHPGRAAAELSCQFVLPQFVCRSCSGLEMQQNGSCVTWYFTLALICIAI